MKKLVLGIIMLGLIIAGLSGCGSEKITAMDYTNPENWAYYGESAGDETLAKVFFIAPEVDLGENGNMNMDLADADMKENFLGAINMEKGIYDTSAEFYAPYYRQAAMPVYSMDAEEAEPYFDLAYADVKAAFEQFLAVTDESAPIYLAGFSEGGDMVIRLMKDYFKDDVLRERLVAAYALGWRLTEEDIKECPWIEPAMGETDTGTVIVFNAEAEDVTDSILVPAGVKSCCINPLNWATDSKAAGKDLNFGACFTDYGGNIISEIQNLTGAYIDETRGTLKLPDINPADYANTLFPDGVYHLYDYQFFYRNLQGNVSARLSAWKRGH